MALLFSFCAECATIARDTLIAHRGESIFAPENTLPAFKLAVERGFGFECDVYLSKDGKVFTFHDRNLSRTTGGVNRKKCSEATWDEISRLDVGNWGRWKGSKFVGTRPALLEEVLKLARDGRYIYVEVKPGPEIVPYIKRVFQKQCKATPSNTLFISFNGHTCKILKEMMPEYKVYWLTTGRHEHKPDKPLISAEEIVSKLRRIGANGVDCLYLPEVTTAGFIEKVRNAGYEFHMWTIDRFEDAKEAFRRGAMTVTTNSARKLYEKFMAEKSRQH